MKNSKTVADRKNQDKRMSRRGDVEGKKLPAASSASHKTTSLPIWEIARTISSSVPQKEWNKIPSDLSKNLDRYLYGVPVFKK